MMNKEFIRVQLSSSGIADGTESVLYVT